MQEEKVNGTISNRQVADSGGKIVFENPTLCSQLLSNYSGIDLLKNVKPEDIEDVTERFIPMFTEQRDADVVKKVHLSNEDVFVTLIEHKSSVDYNVAMQILGYMIFIWEDYGKQMEAIHPGITHTKDFKYPPVLPIVYYEGDSKWNVENTLKPRIALNSAFSDFIPDFKYHLISLDSFDRDELINRNDGMSFVMLINRITNDIQNLVDQLKERKSMALFDNYVASFDAQVERRIGAENKLILMVCRKMDKGMDAQGIAEAVEESEELIQSIMEVAKKYSPDYDVDKIRTELCEMEVLTT